MILETDIYNLLKTSYGLDDAQVDSWLNSPNKAFNLETPNSVIQDNREIEVLTYLKRLSYVRRFH